MGVSNSGSDVLVGGTGVTLAGFTNAAASNIKVQDSTIYTITTGVIGSNATGNIKLTNVAGCIANLDGGHTFVCTAAITSSGDSVANTYLSIRGAKLIMTSDPGVAGPIVPMVGDSQTQIVLRANGRTWNSDSPSLYLDGATFTFLTTGDGVLGFHPSAVVKNVKFLWASTTQFHFYMGANQSWATSNKPIALDGYSFRSISGNNLISIWTLSGTGASGQAANNYFFVNRDWTYDVALPGARPTAMLRSYRRTDATALSTSYWGAVSICPTLLHIDLKTSLSASGVPESEPTYLRTVQYISLGTTAGDKAVDILSLRFKPTLVDPVGKKLSSASVVVLNTNANCSAANSIGNFRSRLVASGITDSTGQIAITEPSTKNYASSASHRTDSIVIRNRTLTTAWHKWWEAGTKLITIADSRNGTGLTAPESYAVTDYAVSYRRAGSQFLSGSLDMSAPQSPTVALAVDANYNEFASTGGVTVTYASGVTTVALAAGECSLDSIWKAVIDFHAHPDRNEAESVLPFSAWTAGVMKFGSDLQITGTPAAVITAGTLIKSIVASVPVEYGSAGNPSITAELEDPTGTSAQLSLSNLASAAVAVYDGTGAQADYQASVTGVYTANYAPGQTGTWKWVVAKQGYKTATGTFAPGAGGLFAQAVTLIPDVSVEADASTYTELTTSQSIYDYLSYWHTTQAGIAVTPFATLSGITVGLSPYDVVIDKDASQVVSIASGVLTLKSTTLTGNVASSGSIALANGSSVTGFVQYESSIVCNLRGLDPSALGTTWVLGWIKSTDYDARPANSPPASWTGWSQSSGVGNTTRVTFAQNTQYKLFLRILGYYAPIGPIATFDTGVSQDITLAPIVDTDLSGNTIWPQTSVHQTQASKLAYSYTDQIVEYHNATGSVEYIPFLAAYRALESIAKSPSMAYQLIQPVYLNATKDGFVVPPGNPLLARMSSDSTAGAVMKADVSYAANFQPAYDRFRANPAHVHLLVPVTAASNAGDSSGGVTLTQIEASTVLAKKADVQAIETAIGTPLQAGDYTAPDNTSVAAIKAKTDNLPASPAAVGSAMVLTSAYDSAKTAASLTQIEATGGKLDKAMKAAQAAEDQTV